MFVLTKRNLFTIIDFNRFNLQIPIYMFIFILRFSVPTTKYLLATIHGFIRRYYLSLIFLSF